MSVVTVILTAYRRPGLLREQLEAVRFQTLTPAEVWLWANEPNRDVRAVVDGLAFDRVVTSSRNDYVHARFALALTARTEFVAVFDDDTLPGWRWLENCATTFHRTPGILGTAGVRLWDEGYAHRSVHGWHDPKPETIEVDLVGHAWFLKTEWVHHLFSVPAVTGTNGEDIELSARAWRRGDIRTFCPPHPPDDRSLWGSLRGLAWGDDAVALSRRPSHLEERERIVRAEIAAGWQPLFQRHSLLSLGNEPASPPSGAVTSSTSLSVSKFPALDLPLSSPDAKTRPAARPSDFASLDDAIPFDRVPVAGHRILLIGRNVGPLAERVRLRRPVSLAVVELEPDHLEQTRRHAPDARGVNEAEGWPEYAANSFDGIFGFSLLDGAIPPDVVLKRLRPWIAPDGHLALIVGNVQEHGIVAGLLAGRWTPNDEPPGRRPLRFFTRREIEKLLFRAGFIAGEPVVLPGPGHGDWVSNGRPGEVRAGNLHVGGLRPTDAEEFFCRGFLVDATPVKVVDFGVTSIILVTHNQLEYTRSCVESVRRLTDEPYELIVVDNASTDGTLNFFRGVPGAKVIANRDNRGFPAAVNQGLAVASGDQILLLNNDTIVTTGWLRRLLSALHSDPAIGLVGPCSNCVSGPQQVEAGYETLAALDGFAWERAKTLDGLRDDTNRLVGFCLLIRRAVIDAIGSLDERFGVGCFEDDDYCLRALRAGYRAVIARDAFVHHFGGRTFVGSGADFGAIMRENERRFREKWEAMVPTPPLKPSPELVLPSETASDRERPGRYKAVMVPGGGLLLQRTHVHLSLCMIVRDNARTLRPCLDGIYPWVDELVIVDTGSIDETPQIALSYGARLFHFPWCDDFSAARNESVRHARGAWVFWMDSDDTIDADCGRRLRELAYRDSAPGVLGYVIQVHCPGTGEDGVSDVTAVDHVKLFRNRPDLRFEGRIHEQIIPAIRRAGGELAWTDLFVVHSGSEHTPEAQQRKWERDLRLLDLENRERPDHPFTLFNFGMTYSDAERYEEAVEALVRGIERSGVGDSHLRKAYALLLFAQMKLGRTADALQTCERGRALFPEDAELRFRQGVLLHDLGRYQEAATAYRDVLNNHEERHFSSVDRGIFGYKTRHNLAIAAAAMDDLTESERQWREVVREVPLYRPGWRGLGEVLLRCGRFDAALETADRMLAESSLRPEGMLLRALVAVGQGAVEQARARYGEATASYPDDLQILRGLCQFLFDHGSSREAEEALRKLSERDPADASAHHNLGTLLLRGKRYGEATEAYRASLQLRPDAAATYLHLGYALKESRRLDEAVAAWEQVLRLEPGHPAAADELNRLGAGARR
jgi:O-antigen biosynthesis protein